MQIKLRKECFYNYIYFSPLGFAQALQPEGIPCCLGNLERSSCAHRCFDRTHQASASKLYNVDFHKSKKFTNNGWRPQSLLS